MVPLLELAAAAVAQTSCDPFVLNVGSGDGQEYNDPTWPLYVCGQFAGLSVDPGTFETKTLRWPHLKLALRPQRAQIFKGMPYAVLKVDIDGYDALILETLLDCGHRPSIIQVEVQPEIPPPYRFTVLEDPKFEQGGHFGFYGASLSYMTSMVERFGYHLAGLDFTSGFTHDAIYTGDWYTARRDVQTAWQEEPPGARHLDAVGIDSMAWRKGVEPDVIRKALELAATAKGHGTPLPFLFE